MKRRKSARGLFFYGLICVLLIFAVSALSGCSLKYKGPRITEEGVMFRMKAPDAERVAIAGSFNQWETDKDMLSGPDKNGVWSIFIPLTDGRYEYLFIVDGTHWLLDPAAPSAGDGLGGRNSVISIQR
jgi:1,4-alpha-glucan branching enzyme